MFRGDYTIWKISPNLSYVRPRALSLEEESILAFAV